MMATLFTYRVTALLSFVVMMGFVVDRVHGDIFVVGNTRQRYSNDEPDTTDETTGDGTTAEDDVGDDFLQSRKSPMEMEGGGGLRAVFDQFRNAPRTPAPTGIPTQSIQPSHSIAPSDNPTISAAPSSPPTTWPTFKPSTGWPTRSPIDMPSSGPTTLPSFSPSAFPSHTPTKAPSLSPTLTPSVSPSQVPTFSPSSQPSRSPSAQPTTSPTLSPTGVPSTYPTRQGDVRCRFSVLFLNSSEEESYLNLDYFPPNNNNARIVFTAPAKANRSISRSRTLISGEYVLSWYTPEGFDEPASLVLTMDDVEFETLSPPGTGERSFGTHTFRCPV